MNYYEKEIQQVKENLIIKKDLLTNNLKLEYEKEIDQIRNNYLFMENNMSNEKDALLRILNVNSIFYFLKNTIKHYYLF
jgi:hypothetical protein